MGTSIPTTGTAAAFSARRPQTAVRFGSNSSQTNTALPKQNGLGKRASLKIIQWYRGENKGYNIRNSWAFRNLYARIVHCGFEEETCSHVGLNLFQNPAIGFIKASFLTALRILVCNPVVMWVPAIKKRVVPKFETSEAMLAWGNKISLKAATGAGKRLLHLA